MEIAAIKSFSQLLDEPRCGVRNWVAFHILELMDAPSDVVDRAFAVLEEIAKGDGVEAPGTRIELEHLRRRLKR